MEPAGVPAQQAQNLRQEHVCFCVFSDEQIPWPLGQGALKV